MRTVEYRPFRRVPVAPFGAFEHSVRLAWLQYNPVAVKTSDTRRLFFKYLKVLIFGWIQQK